MVDDGKIHRRKLYEDVAEKIASWIRSGHFREGDKLPSEREIMISLGVGRTSVREALFALNRSGLIEIRNGSRAVVSRPNPQVLLRDLGELAQEILQSNEGQQQFQEARIFWEASLARYAAKHATEEDLGELQLLLQENESALKDLDRFARTDIAFHNRIARIAGNPIFTAVNNALDEWLADQRTTSLRRDNMALLAFEAHRRILEAIRAKDPDRAERAMTDHLGQVQNAYWKVRR